MRFSHHVFGNGLHFIGEHHDTAQSMAFGCFVRTGSRDEGPEMSGVSHFLEHMMFKGTARRTAEDVNREFDEIGAQYNAFTSEETTVYFGAVLPAYQERLIDLLVDMMRPTLQADDFEMEKQVILEEIALYQDRPEYLVFDLARETYFDGHPLGNSVLGSIESIQALTCDQMEGYWQQRYAPDNMVLVVTGCYDWDAALTQVEELTRGWRPAGADRVLELPRPRPQQQAVTRDHLQQVHLCWAFPGFSAQQEERWSAQVAAHALGDGRGSRLYWALVYPGLARTARLEHLDEDGAGLYLLYACCEPERTEEVIAVVDGMLAAVRREGLSQTEIRRAQRKLASAYMLQGETPFGRLVPAGLNWLYRREQRRIEEEVDQVLALRPEQVAAALQANPFEPAALLTLGPDRS